VSIDLQGWHHANPKYPRRKLQSFLDVLGANHSEGSLGLRWYDADESSTFMEQVDLVIKGLGEDLDAQWVQGFRQRAEAFKEEAEAKGRIIISDWL
jgi:hypothetical protein